MHDRPWMQLKVISLGQKQLRNAQSDYCTCMRISRLLPAVMIMTKINRMNIIGKWKFLEESTNLMMVEILLLPVIKDLW